MNFAFESTLQTKKIKTKDHDTNNQFNNATN
jgi:hypothetical protein